MGDKQLDLADIDNACRRAQTESQQCDGDRQRSIARGGALRNGTEAQVWHWLQLTPTVAAKEHETATGVSAAGQTDWAQATLGRRIGRQDSPELPRDLAASGISLGRRIWIASSCWFEIG